MPLHFVYRHIRNDLQIPFYIGMGTSFYEKSQIDTVRYKRAYSSLNRNKFWQSIVAKSGFSVEIIWESSDKNEVMEKEKEFIKIHGRRINGDGILCNVLDGGDGGDISSPESIKRSVKKNKENGCYDKTKDILVKRNRTFGHPLKGKRRSPESASNKKVYAYNNEHGNFIGCFNSRKDAAIELGLKCAINVGKAVKLGRPYCGFMFFNEKQNGNITSVTHHKLKKVYKICPKTGAVVDVFDSSKEVCDISGTGSNVFCEVIKQKRMHLGFYWSFNDKIILSDYRTSKIVSQRGTRKTTCANCGGEKTGKSIKWSYCNSCNAKRVRLIYQKNKVT